MGGRDVGYGSDGIVMVYRAKPILEARNEIFPFDMQRPPEGIEGGQGREQAETLPVPSGQPGFSPGVRHRCVNKCDENNEGQTHQVRRSQKKTMPHHKIANSTDKDYPQNHSGRRHRRCRQSSIEAKSMEIYQPSEGSEGKQDDSSYNYPSPARKSPRQAAGKQAQHAHTSYLIRTHPKHHGIIRPLDSQDFDSSDTRTFQAAAATFQEWSLPDAALKRAVVNGVATFQLQFTWSHI